MRKSPLFKLISKLICCLLSLVVIVACSSEDKASMRDGTGGRSNKTDPNDPTDPNGKPARERAFAAESVFALALAGVSELSRATDIMLNEDNSKTLHSPGRCQDVDVAAKSETSDVVTVNTIKRGCTQGPLSWEGLEVYTKNYDNQRVLKSAVLSMEGEPTELTGPNATLLITGHEIDWKPAGANTYSYKQQLTFKITFKATSRREFTAILNNHGIVTVDPGSNQVNKITMTEVPVDENGEKVNNLVIIGRQEGRTSVRATLDFTNMAERAVRNGRAIGEWSGEENLIIPNQEPYQVRGESTDSRVASKTSRRSINLRNAPTGFTALQENLEKIGITLDADLGR